MAVEKASGTRSRTRCAGAESSAPGLRAAPGLALAVLARRALLPSEEDARARGLRPDEALAVLADPPGRLHALWDRSGLAGALAVPVAPGSDAWTAVSAALAVTDARAAVDRLLDDDSLDPKGRLGPTASSSSLAAWVAACAGPPRGTVTDPACGEGRFLATMADRAAATLVPEEDAAASQGGRDAGASRAGRRAGTMLRLIGLDTSGRALASAATRLLVRGRDADLVQRSALTAQAMSDLAGSADIVVVDPPTGGLTQRQREASKQDPTPFGRVPVDDQAYLWIATALDLLAPGGRAVVVTPLRTLERTGRAGAFRAGIVNAGHVLAAVTLPRGMRPGAAPALALWVLQQPARPGPVLVVDGARVNEQYASAGDRDPSAASGALALVEASIDAVAAARSTEPPSADGLAAVVADGFSLVSDVTADDPLVPWAGPRTWRPAPEGDQAGGPAASRGIAHDSVPGAPTDDQARAALVDRVRAARDRLTAVLTLAERIQAGQVPGLAYRSLGDLIADGVVHAFLPSPRDRGEVGGSLHLMPSRANRGYAPGQESAQVAGDVVAFPTPDGADTFLAQGSTRMRSGPLVVLRPDPGQDGVSARILHVAIRAATIHGWPYDSRGPLPLTKAWNVIPVPVLDPHDPVAGAHLDAVTAYADLQDLPQALTDPRLLSR